jgi:hypothetical protein
MKDQSLHFRFLFVYFNSPLEASLVRLSKSPGNSVLRTQFKISGNSSET